MTTFTVNEHVTWAYKPRGGYNYLIPVNAKILDIKNNRVKIEVMKVNSDKVNRWVLSDNLYKKH